MTSIVCWALVIFLFLSVVVLAEFFRANRSWIAFFLCLCLLVRVALATVLSGGLQYVFVVDSLGYEYKGWLLAQPWMSADLFPTFAAGNLGTYNYYELFMADIFKMFGREPLVATLCNCLLSTFTIGLLVAIYRFFFAENRDSKRTMYSSVCLVIVLSVYPSFLIWSATNTRDPLYFFCCSLFFACFMTAFSKRIQIGPLWRLTALAGAGASMWLVLGVRAYVNALFVLSIGAAFVLYAASKKISWKWLAPLTAMSTVAGLYIYQNMFPEQTEKILKNLTETRLSFANLNLLDSVAKSSFGLDETFRSVTDILLFVPSAISHYFFGPFLWEVSSGLQAAALLEAFVIYALVMPTIRGVKKAYQRAPFETTLILVFVLSFSIAQSLIISNMGTIFRHRTLTFLFILIFTCEGLYDGAKKSFPSLFKA